MVASFDRRGTGRTTMIRWLHSQASVIVTLGPFPESWLYLRIGDRYWQLGSWYVEWGPFPDKYEARTRYGWYDGYLFRS